MSCKRNSIVNSSHSIIIAVFLVLVTSISVIGIVSNQPKITMAQQQQQQQQSSQVVNQTSSVLKQQPNLQGVSFVIDNVTFSHHMASVNGGIQLHYVIGGHGDPIVLLHGWPETWYEWRHVMPALAKNYTVIAPDLRGLGDSSKPLTGYDGKTVAEDIHQLVGKLGFKTIFLVGHDIGTQVAYSYAAAHPNEVKKLAVMDFTIPGFGPTGRPPIWWHNVSHYSAPGGMRAGFEYYRAFPQDAIQNQNYSKTKLTMPVLAVGAGYIPVLGGNITMPSIVYGMKILAQNVEGITVPNSGHWIQEEQPVLLVKLLNNFFSGKPGEASK
jgi:pimeloyl-ACP methyl ester carboxylesterase